MTIEVKQGGQAVEGDGLTLNLGGSMRAFLRQIVIEGAGGGPRGTATRLRDQITWLAYVNVIVTETREHGNGEWNHRGANFGFVTETNLWWSDRDNGTPTLWPLLSRQFGSQYAVLRQFKAQVVKQLQVGSLAYRPPTWRSPTMACSCVLRPHRSLARPFSSYEHG